MKPIVFIAITVVLFGLGVLLFSTNAFGLIFGTVLGLLWLLLFMSQKIYQTIASQLAQQTRQTNAQLETNRLLLKIAQLLGEPLELPVESTPQERASA